MKPGDGLEAVEEHNGRAAEELNVLIVDAGSSDASLAMSCPPAPFLKTAFLKAAHRALKPSGLLVVNCVTRSDTAFQEAYKKVEVSLISDLVRLRFTGIWLGNSLLVDLLSTYEPNDLPIFDS